MTQAESTRLKAFTRKMRDEGADGFAAGPWDEAETPVTARQRLQARWATQSARQRRWRWQALTERILTWTAIIALLALTIGIVGAWLSYQPNTRTSVTRPITLNKSTLERFETRLERMEKRLSTILEPYIRTLNNLDSRLKETGEELSARIRILEMGTTPAADGTYEERLQSLETRLTATMARLDEVALMLAALGENPAPGFDRFSGAVPDETAWAESAATDLGEPAQDDPFAIAPPAPDPLAPQEEAVSAAPVPDTLQTLPAAAADEDSPADGQEATQPAHLPQPATAAAGAIPEAGAAPQEPAAQAAAAPPPPHTGNWVINIASYTNEAVARRKLAAMQQQGIDVELVTAEVNGRTIYRARVFGFDTRQEAAARAGTIQKKLGLKETWIARR
jgi:hypothetical protein